MYSNRELSLTSIIKSSNPGTELCGQPIIIYVKNNIYIYTHITEVASGEKNWLAGTESTWDLFFSLSFCLLNLVLHVPKFRYIAFFQLRNA